jgi:Icc-related predicted phosphoesterase
MPRIYFKEFDAIIAPGDFCSDKGIREVFMRMYKKYVKNVDDYYDWWDLVGKNNAKRMITESLKAGRRILESLDSYNKPVFLVPGNWDWTKSGKEKWEFMEKDFWNDYLLKGLKNVHDVDGKIRIFNDIQFIGYGRCNGPEILRLRGYGNIKKNQYEKNQRKYKRLLARYDKKFKSLSKHTPVIFLTHNVPYNTRLDTIVNKKSPVNGKHYGSNLARAMIEKYQPMLAIGGHMHEHFGKDIIRKTTIINAGFGSNVNTLLEIENGKIRKIIFHRGK